MFETIKRVSGELVVLVAVIQIVYNLMNLLAGLSFDTRAVAVSALLVAVSLLAVRLK